MRGGAPEWIGEAHLCGSAAVISGRYAPACRRADEISSARKSGSRLRCQRITVSGLINRDRIQDAWCDPVQADEDQTVKIA